MFKKVSIKSFIKYKNILALYGFVLMLIFTIADPTGHGANHGLFIKLLSIIWPLGTSSILWNKWLHSMLVSDSESSYSGITYKNFILLGLFLILFFDAGMTIGLYQYFLS